MAGEDLAALGVKIDASEVDAATPKFEKMAQAADAADKATGDLTITAKELSNALGQTNNNIERAIALIQSQRNAAAAAATATQAATTASTAQAAAQAASSATQAAANATLAQSLGSLGTTSVRTAAAQVASTQAAAQAVVASSATQIAANTNVAASNIAMSTVVRESLVLMREASVGNYTRMAGSASILIQALGLMYSVLLPLVAVVATLGAAFALATNQINSGKDGTGDLTRELKLNAEQLERVENRYVTLGDTAKAVFQVLFHDLVSDNTKSLWQEFWNGVAIVAAGSLEYIAGTVLGTVRIIEEAWKGMPTFLGGQGTLAGTDFAKAFQSGLDDAKKGLNNFYTDVGNVARQNAANRILKEAGKGPKEHEDSTVSTAERQITKLKDETAAQNELNDAVAAGTLTIGQANDAAKLYQQTASEVARIEHDSKLSQEEKEALIKRLTTAQLEYNASVKQADFDKQIDSLENQNQSIHLQTSLIGENARVIAEETAELKARQEAALKNYSPDQVRLYVQAMRELADQQLNNKQAQDTYNESLKLQADLMDELAKHAEAMASGLSDSLGHVGQAIQDLTSTYANYQSAQSKFLEREKEIQKEREAGKDTTNEEIILTQQKKDADTEYYADVLGAAKNFFGQNTAMYKLLQAAETAYRVYQLSMSIAAIAVKETETAAVVAANSIQTASSATTAVANAAADVPFPFNLGAIATIVAVLAGFGILAGGGGGGSAASVPVPDVSKVRQAAQGSGSVLGDAEGKSESIANSLDQLSKDTNTDLEYSSEMVVSLRSIDNKIGDLTAKLAVQLQVGGSLNTAGLGLGSSSSGVGSGIPLLGGIVSSLFGSSSSSTTLLDQGLNILGTTIGQAVTSGINASTYQTTQTTSKSSSLFGLISSSRTSQNTSNSYLGSDFNNSLQDVIVGLRDTVLTAANKLGVEGAQSVVDSFSINLGSISLKDMTGDEIQTTLNAVFGKLGDDLVAAAIPQVTQMQKVGEGALETLSRLVQEYQVVDDAAKTVGFTFSQVGVNSLAARDRLVELSGGLDNFYKQSQFFVSNFLDNAKGIAPIAQSVSAEMRRLGLGFVDTKDEFANLVQSLDTSTESGASLYAALMNVAPAFAKVAEYTQDLADSKLSLLIKYYQNLGDTLTATNLERQKELDALDASLVVYQKLVYASEDLNTAQDNLTTAQEALTKAQQAANQTTQQSIDKFKGFVTSLTQFQQTLTTGPLALNNPVRQYNLTRSVLQSTGAAAAGGDATALGNVQAAGSDFLTASAARSRTLLDYLRDVASVRNVVAQSISAAQHQVDIYTQQLYAINDVDNSVMSVKEAIDNLTAMQIAYNQASLTLQQAQASVNLNGWGGGDFFGNPTFLNAFLPGHASGLNRVPYDNYLMRAHKDEAILNAPDAARWRAGGSPDVTAELKSLRADLVAAVKQTTKNTNDTNIILRKLTDDGQAINIRDVT